MKGRTMAAKRKKNGQFVKGGKSSSSSGAKRSKAKGKSSKSSKAKGMAKRANGLASARAEYMMKKPAAGDSVKVALSKIHHNQAVLARGLTIVADEVAVHRRALVGAGLIAARGGA